MKVETQQEGYTNKLNKTNLDKFVSLTLEVAC